MLKFDKMSLFGSLDFEKATLVRQAAAMNNWIITPAPDLARQPAMCWPTAFWFHHTSAGEAKP
jgi:hypothetical protein